MTSSDYGKRADKFSVANDGLHREDGTPVLKSVPHGEVVVKDVEHYTINCPECGTVGRHQEKGEIICDNDACALVLSDSPPLAFEDYGQRTHNAANTMGKSMGGTSTSKPAADPSAGTATSE